MTRERTAAPAVGAKFSLDGEGNEVFSFVIDHGNQIGPRPATDDDREKHASAYEAFLDAQTEPAGGEDAPRPRRGRPRKV